MKGPFKAMPAGSAECPQRNFQSQISNQIRELSKFNLLVKLLNPIFRLKHTSNYSQHTPQSLPPVPLSLLALSKFSLYLSWVKDLCLACVNNIQHLCSTFECSSTLLSVQHPCKVGKYW